MRLTLYMLEPGTKCDRTALRNVSAWMDVPLANPPANVTAALFVKPPPAQKNEPKWVKDLAVLVGGSTGLNIQSVHGGAVLLVKRAGAVYAVTFGTGFHAVDDARIVRGFGILVTANSVASNEMKAADKQNLQVGGASQRTVLGKEGDLYRLGITPSEEIVRELSGKGANPAFASTVAGADSLRLNVKDFSLQNLAGKLDEIAGLYKSKVYRGKFSFLDDIRRLNPREPRALELTAALHLLVIGESPDVYFALPDPLSQYTAEEYKFSLGKNEEALEELDQAAVYATLRDLQSSEPLTKVRVSALDGNGQQLGRKAALMNYIQCEMVHQGENYVLNSGQWFKVAGTFKQEVDDYIAGIDDWTVRLDLPAWTVSTLKADGEDSGEGKYNEGVCEGRTDAALMDKQNLSFGGHDRIEVCDILLKDKTMICVKRASSSSTLSHAFSQASVSSSLMATPEYGTHVLKFLGRVAPGAQMGGPTDWTFVYALATEKPGPLDKSLFFFSKVNLRNHAQQIRSRGHNVALCRIEMS